MAEVTLEDLSKVNGGDVAAVRDISLDIADGAFVVFVGSSGFGKFTALRMIAGLEDISSGKVFVEDQVLNDIPPRGRDIAMVADAGLTVVAGRYMGTTHGKLRLGAGPSASAEEGEHAPNGPVLRPEGGTLRDSKEARSSEPRDREQTRPPCRVSDSRRR